MYIQNDWKSMNSSEWRFKLGCKLLMQYLCLLATVLFNPSPLILSWTPLLLPSHFTSIHFLCLIKGEMCQFCATSVSKVSLFGQVFRNLFLHWLAKLKPLVKPLLLFWAGLHSSFSGSGTKTNANKWRCQWVRFIITEFHTQKFQRNDSL